MFEDNINSLQQIKDSFLDAVEDSFGNAINRDLLDVLYQNLNSLENTYRQAELHIKEIKIKTMELRSII